MIDIGTGWEFGINGEWVKAWWIRTWQKGKMCFILYNEQSKVAKLDLYFLEEALTLEDVSLKINLRDKNITRLIHQLEELEEKSVDSIIKAIKEINHGNRKRKISRN